MTESIKSRLQTLRAEVTRQGQQLRTQLEELNKQNKFLKAMLACSSVLTSPSNNDRLALSIDVPSIDNGYEASDIRVSKQSHLRSSSKEPNLFVTRQRPDIWQRVDREGDIRRIVFNSNEVDIKMPLVSPSGAIRLSEMNSRSKKSLHIGENRLNSCESRSRVKSSVNKNKTNVEHIFSEEPIIEHFTGTLGAIPEVKAVEQPSFSRSRGEDFVRRQILEQKTRNLNFKSPFNSPTNTSALQRATKSFSSCSSFNGGLDLKSLGLLTNALQEKQRDQKADPLTKYSLLTSPRDRKKQLDGQPEREFLSSLRNNREEHKKDHNFKSTKFIVSPGGINSLLTKNNTEHKEDSCSDSERTLHRSKKPMKSNSNSNLIRPLAIDLERTSKPVTAFNMSFSPKGNLSLAHILQENPVKRLK